jgi:hypothetical protein
MNPYPSGIHALDGIASLFTEQFHHSGSNQLVEDRAVKMAAVMPLMKIRQQTRPAIRLE